MKKVDYIYTCVYYAKYPERITHYFVRRYSAIKLKSIFHQMLRNIKDLVYFALFKNLGNVKLVYVTCSRFVSFNRHVVMLAR